MLSSVVSPERIRSLNDAEVVGGRYVLYWMQQSQRAARNHALEVAIQRANGLGLPVVVGFGLTGDYPEANQRHYRFLLEGLAQTATALEGRHLGFSLRLGEPADVALELAGDAALVVCDRGYLRHQREWRRRVAQEAGRLVLEVETDVVVPVETASSKREYAARTLRPKIHERLDDFLVDVATTPVERRDPPALAGEDPDDVEGLLDRLGLDRSVPPVRRFRGGAGQARSRLRRFLDDGLRGYSGGRREPAEDGVSFLSPYLHFGQISPLAVAIEVVDSGAPEADVEAFLEELVVRRELACNYVVFEPAYDRYEALPEWCRKTLADHADDPREHVYDEADLVGCDTHDPYWNAAMREMTATGFMHNTMRMYWGKKILEWTEDPAEAFGLTLRLNNRYFLDGRDPNSFANVAWIFGLHDRPWGERPVYGTVRTMTAGGLERKFDMEAYVERVDELVEAEGR